MISRELVKKITLPDSFEAPHRPDMVKMAVASSRANRRQATVPNQTERRDQWRMKHSVEWWGTSVSRISVELVKEEVHKTAYSVAVHGPKVEKDWSRKLNMQERHHRDSAIAATTSVQMVRDRGHHVEEIENLPLSLETTKKFEVRNLNQSISRCST